MAHPNIKRILNKTLRQPAYALRTGIKRLGAYAAYRFGNGRSEPPEAVTIFLTRKCNLHCKMCGQWGEGGVTGRRSEEIIQEELPLDILKKRLDEMASFSPGVTLFGGEPLLYKGCLELIRHIKANRMHCLIITNGFLVHDLARELVDSGLDELNVSLDGRREVHDRIRGMNGLFDKIMSGLEAVRDIKISSGGKRPLVNIQCTISKYNYRDLEDMIEIARGLRADSLTFHNLIFTNKEILEKQKRFDDILGSSSEDWRGFDFDPGVDPDVVRDEMDRMLGGRYPFGVDFYPNLSRSALRSYYRDPAFVPREYRARCLSPWIAAYIFPKVI